MRTYVIAEAGVNHNGSMDLARRLVDLAAARGADAIKFQTFRAESVAVASASQAPYQRRNTGSGQSQRDMLRALELDEEQHRLLVAHCAERGIAFLSTPFDLESVGLLADTLDLPCLKVSSGDITNGPLLLRTARSGKRVILSTGMSTLGEIEDALGVLAFGYAGAGEPSRAAFEAAYAGSEGRQALRENVTLLHCTSEYPAPVAEVNLAVLDTLRQAFGLRVGYSDHTRGIVVPIAAVARGACVIEKHMTLDRSLPGPDHQASLEPEEFGAMVEGIREAEQAIGSAHKVPTASELLNRTIARRSLVAARDIELGARLTDADLAVKRPGAGLSPMRFWDRIGRVAARAYRADDPLE